MFYTSDLVHQAILFAIATLCVANEAHHVMASLPKEVRRTRADVSSTLCELRSADQYGRLRQCVRHVITLAPLQFVLRPPLAFAWHLVDDKFDQVPASNAV